MTQVNPENMPIPGESKTSPPHAEPMPDFFEGDPPRKVDLAPEEEPHPEPLRTNDAPGGGRA